VLTGVAEQQLLLCGGSALACGRQVLEQDGEPLGSFRMVAGRMQACERAMRQDVDARTAAASSSRVAPPALARPSR
jgi:hypothetical protein